MSYIAHMRKLEILSDVMVSLAEYSTEIVGYTRKASRVCKGMLELFLVSTSSYSEAYSCLVYQVPSTSGLTELLPAGSCLPLFL